MIIIDTSNIIIILLIFIFIYLIITLSLCNLSVSNKLSCDPWPDYQYGLHRNNDRRGSGHAFQYSFARCRRHQHGICYYFTHFCRMGGVYFQVCVSVYKWSYFYILVLLLCSYYALYDIVVSVFEVFNACQCFAMPAMLSAGKNDSPLDLVKWKAYLVRIMCCIIGYCPLLH